MERILDGHKWPPTGRSAGLMPRARWLFGCRGTATDITIVFVGQMGLMGQMGGMGSGGNGLDGRGVFLTAIMTVHGTKRIGGGADAPGMVAFGLQ